jgi:hypothetical protein
LNTQRLTAILATVLICIAGAAIAQEATESPKAAASDAANANNPLASITAFNIQNYYVASLSELDDQSANNFWLRYAQPLPKGWLFRASLPASRVPTGGSETTSGLGDLNLNVWWTTTLRSGTMFGVGPTFNVPTATEDETGSGKWQGGVSLLMFDGTSKRFQWGGLLAWQKDFAGDDDRADAQSVVLQPIYFVQLGGGLYTGGAPIMVYNVETSNYHVPVGLRLGKVMPGPKVVYNVFIEPQWTILDRGPGQPEFQIYAAVNLQFK